MASVYVGTYGKYNNGNLAGGWLDLADYEKYEDFLQACAELHKDERDPEYMIQDSESFPDGLDCMEWLSKQEFEDVKLAMLEAQQENEGKPAINIVDYSEKAFAVVGDTRSVKDKLKQLGGRFNKRLTCGAGWIFSNKMRESVEKFISSGEVAESVKQDRAKMVEGGEQFVKWLDEYFTLEGVDVDRNHYVGAIKMHDHYYLLEKRGIETRFCFHDEGSDYEFYKTLNANESKLANYFKSQNLREFDSKIKHIEKGEDFNNDNRVWWYLSDSIYSKNKLYLQYYYRGEDEDLTLCTDDEKKLIVKGLKYARKCFEKRLDSYLKRYGVSKLHTWTYWADA